MKSVRNGYENLGIEKYYEQNKDTYVNPHKEIVQSLLRYAKDNWNLGNNLLDLCCGSGEATEIFKNCNITGSDPYTYNLYMKNTGKSCNTQTFKDIVCDGLIGNYNTVICSFAMHLCEESMLPILLWQISQKTEKLLILTPHKRPNCDNISGWKVEKIKKEGKVTMTLYVKD